MKSNAEDAYYSQLGSLRIDVLEHTKDATTCVYDIKTGLAGLRSSRMSELAQAVYKNYPDTRRILVIEVRPTR